MPDVEVESRNEGGFPALRPLMFSIAYRMVGSVSEAEDIVQDAYLRLQRSGQLPGAGRAAQTPDRGAPADESARAEAAEPVRSPEAYAATITTRLAIDHLRSAQARREAYVGPWLPEPMLTDEDADPAYQIERDETLSLAFLVLLERLSPVERAVFVLREVFQYEYEEIAEIVGKEPSNCRQIMARARRHIEDQRPRFEASPQRRRELAAQFLAALNDGDVEGLERLLAQDVAFYGTVAGRHRRSRLRFSGVVGSHGSSSGWRGRPRRWACGSNSSRSTASQGCGRWTPETRWSRFSAWMSWMVLSRP